MKRIYIGGKLSADAVDYIKNLHILCEWAEKIRRIGYSVFVPGLDFLMGFKFGNWDYDDYIRNSLEWLKVSDALFIVPDSLQSKGVQIEIEVAKGNNIPIYYADEDGYEKSIVGEIRNAKQN